MGLQVFLPLNGNANNYGIMGGTPTVNGGTWENGRDGKCFNSGGTGYIVMNTSITLNTPFTFAIWIKVNSFNGSWMRIFQVRKNGNEYCAMGYSSSNSIGFHIYDDVSGTRTRVFDNYYITGVQTGVWIHAAVTFDGTNLKQYRDGQLIATGTLDPGMQLNDTYTSLHICTDYNGNYDPNCCVSDFRFYDQVLTQEEIAQIVQGKNMGLQVWLPLTTDYKNYGLSNVTVSPQSNVSLIDGGKLGKCAAASASSNKAITVTVPNLATMLANGKSYSLACWAKLRQNTITSDWMIQLGTNSCGFWWSGSSDPRWTWNENDGGKRSHDPPIANDYTNWHHIVMTVDKTATNMITIHSYVDGGPSNVSATETWNCSGHAQPTGDTITINTYACYFCDIRLYNYVLSPKEVREISKGLVLHYPLSRRGFGQDNLVANSNNFSGWTIASLFTLSQTPSGEYMVSATRSGETAYQWTRVIPTLRLNPNDYPDGITVSFDFKCENISLLDHKCICSLQIYNANSNRIGWYEAKNALTETCYVGSSTLQNGVWKRLTCYFTQANLKTVSTSGYTTSDVSFTMLSFNLVQNGTISFKKIKVESGTIATPWIPNSADTLYSTLQLNGDVEYDVSGFNNNGTRNGTVTWTADTPRYHTSTIFSGSNSSISRPFAIGNVWSVACWAKKDDVGTGFIFQLGTAGAYVSTQFGMHTSSTEGSVATICNTQYNTASLTSYRTWNHYCMTYDGSSLKTYINGELKQTSANTTAQLVGNKLSIGSYFSSNSVVFGGKISDFRVYTTVISAADVLELYRGG